MFKKILYKQLFKQVKAMMYRYGINGYFSKLCVGGYDLS